MSATYGRDPNGQGAPAWSVWTTLPGNIRAPAWVPFSTFSSQNIIITVSSPQTLPQVGQTGTLYLVLSTNTLYYWNGGMFIQISNLSPTFTGLMYANNGVVSAIAESSGTLGYALISQGGGQNNPPTFTAIHQVPLNGQLNQSLVWTNSNPVPYQWANTPGILPPGGTTTSILVGPESAPTWTGSGNDGQIFFLTNGVPTWTNMPAIVEVLPSNVDNQNQSMYMLGVGNATPGNTGENLEVSSFLTFNPGTFAMNIGTNGGSGSASLTLGGTNSTITATNFVGSVNSTNQIQTSSAVTGLMNPYYVPLVQNSSGIQSIFTGSTPSNTLTFDPNTGILTANQFGGQSTSTLAIKLSSVATSLAYDLVLSGTPSGNAVPLNTSSGSYSLTYNPGTGVLSGPSLVSSLASSSLQTYVGDVTALNNEYSITVVTPTALNSQKTIQTSSQITLNPSLNRITATTFNGTANAALTAATATVATTVDVTNDGTQNSSLPLVYVNSAISGTFPILSTNNSSLSINPSTATITATTFSGQATSAVTATTASQASQINITGQPSLVGLSQCPLLFSTSPLVNGSPTVLSVYGNNTVYADLTTSPLATLSTNITGNAATSTTSQFCTSAINVTTTYLSPLTNQEYPIACAIQAGSTEAVYLSQNMTLNPFVSSITATTFNGNATSATVATTSAQTSMINTNGTALNASYAISLLPTSSIGGYSSIYFDSGSSILYNPATATLTVPNLNGNAATATTATTATTAATATVASTVTVANATVNQNYSLAMCNTNSAGSNAVYNNNGLLEFNPSTQVLTVATLNGNAATATTATTATNATNAANIAITSAASNTSYYIPFATSSSGSQALYANGNFSYNPSTSVLNALTFSGNAATATTATSATGAGSISIVNSSTNSNFPMTFVSTSGTFQTVYIDSSVLINPSTHTITAALFNGPSTSAATATTASTVTVNGTAPPTGTYPIVYTLASGSSQTLYGTSSSLSFNPFNGMLTAAIFNGNAATATTATTATNATNATNINMTSVTTNSSYYLSFAQTLGAYSALGGNAGLTFNPSTGNLTTTTFTGALTGNASTASQVSVNANFAGGYATYVTSATGGNETVQVMPTVQIGNNSVTATNFTGLASTASQVLVTSSSGNQNYPLVFCPSAGLGAQNGILGNTVATVNPSTGNVTSTTFTGALSGNATSATTATTANNIVVTSTSANTTYSLLLANSGSSQAVDANSGITANPSTGLVTATTFAGALSGNATTATTLSAISASSGVVTVSSGTPSTVSSSTNFQILGIQSSVPAFFSPNYFNTMNTQTFTSTGAATYTPTTNTKWIEIKLVGGGGAGGGGGGLSAPTTCSVGSGGSGGTYVKAIATFSTSHGSLTALTFGAINIFIGSGGTGSSGGSGGNGGSSYFGYNSGTPSSSSLIAPGGNGGGTSVSSAAYACISEAAPGSSGTNNASSNYLMTSFPGGTGGPGNGACPTPTTCAVFSGRGGDCRAQGGAQGVSNTTASGGGDHSVVGVNGSQGSGGSGGFTVELSGTSQVAVAGGNGGNGYIIVTEYIANLA